MTRYLLMRGGQSLVSLWAVATVVFLLARVGGDPTNLMLPLTATKEQEEILRHALGLDKPVINQYWEFLGNALQGNFGTSTVYSEPATAVIGPRFEASLELVLVTFLFVVVVAIPSGVYAAAHRDGRFDRAVRGAAAVAQAVPNFWLATLLVILFGVEVRLLPIFGNEGLANYVLPVFSLGVFGVAALTRLTRSSVLEALGSEYIKFARAKGVSERDVLWRHALRNGILGVITFSSLLFLGLLTGAVIIETVFSWPGMGQLLVQAVSGHDYPVVQAIVVFLSSMYIVLNFLLDMTYGLIDPRVRVAQ